MNPPSRIDFRLLARRVPTSVPIAIQKATTRLNASRSAAAAQIPEWETLRQTAHDVRLQTIAHLDEYLVQVERAVTAAGGQFYRARDAEAANAIVIDIARRGGVKTAVKGKSMATEEIGLNRAFAQAGIRAVETDVGEFIIQLAQDRPSHLIGPTLHLSKEDIAELFTKKLGIDAPPDPRRLTEIAREQVRHEFLRAEMGITGANLVVADTGTVVLLTNEGNGRLTTTLPDIHVVVAGIDKLIPDWSGLTILLRLLARSATGQGMSCHTSFITGPRRATGENGPREFYLVLVDNGRSAIARNPDTRETLLCIRCAACLNACPVYNQVGGHAYGAVYSGPIGAILTPQLNGLQVGRDLPFASTLCGACADACPVKVPIPRILLHLRSRVARVEGNTGALVPSAVSLSARAAALVLKTPVLYHLGASFSTLVQRLFKHGDWIPNLPAPLDRWTQSRPLPVVNPAFRKWWRAHRPVREVGGNGHGSSRDSSTEVVNRPLVASRSSVLRSGEASRRVLDRHEMDRLVEHINRLSGHACRVSRRGIGNALQELIQSEGIHTAALWTTHGIVDLSLADRLRALGVALVPSDADMHVLADVDLGITEVDLALAETGSLGLFSSSDKPRAISILPRVHLAIVRPAALRADLGQLLQSARSEHYMAVISGLSRTSDIESNPVLGAHGPLALYVWAME